GRAAQGEADQAGADRLVGLAVDQDQAAEVAAVGVGLERQGRVEVQVADGDVVELERARGQRLESPDVDLVADVGDLAGDGGGPEADGVGAAGQQRGVGHPDEVDLELVGDRRRAVGGGEDVA